MVSAFSLAGQTVTQFSQPVQSRTETCMRYWRPLNFGPSAGLVSKDAGAFLRVSSVARYGRMAACGQTREQLPHWMHLVMSHSGTFTAMPRFSYLVVPVGTLPSTENADTGSLSPSCARIGETTVLKYSVASTFTGSAPVVAFSQASGTLTSFRPLMATSMASQFILTIASPFLP